MSERPVPSLLLDIVSRDPAPAPWSEGDNIPWHDPAFSLRMLREHLTQAHDAASRRFEIIDRHVAWIHDDLLHGQPSGILDLGCGPGLYASRLDRLGHTCLGIDYSPASVAYAAAQARREGLRCRYVQEDIRLADYGTGYDLVMLIYGEFNVFRPRDIRTILAKAHQALAPGGHLLLEPHTWDCIRGMERRGPSWYSSQSGLFSESPYLCLEETVWDDDSSTATTRYYIVDAQTGSVTRHAQTFQAYTDEGYQALLGECGFDLLETFPSLEGAGSDGGPELFVIVARRREAS